MSRFILPNLNRTPAVDMVTSSTQTDQTAQHGFVEETTNELEFDNLKELTDPYHTPSPRPVDHGSNFTFAERNNSEQLSLSNVSSGTDQNSISHLQLPQGGLSRKSRLYCIPPKLAEVDKEIDSESKSESESESESTPLQLPMAIIKPPDKITIVEDDEIPGPSSNSIHTDRHSSNHSNHSDIKLEAELILDDRVLLKDGYCSISFPGLHLDDLTELLSQQVVTLQLDKHTKTFKMRVMPSESKRQFGALRPIYKGISNYIGGVVSSCSRTASKKVTFNPDLVRTEIISNGSFSFISISTSDEALVEQSSENDEDILSDLEDFDKD